MLFDCTNCMFSHLSLSLSHCYRLGAYLEPLTHSINYSNFNAAKLTWQTIFRARDARRLSSSNHAQQASPPPPPPPQQQPAPALQQTTQSSSPSKQQVSIAPSTTSSSVQQQQQQQHVVASNQQRPLIKDHLDEETMHRLTVDTLEELDWCLDQLEAIQAHRSVGDLATSKFRRMLNKELSHFSESKSGSQISGYIRSFLGKLDTCMKDSTFTFRFHNCGAITIKRLVFFLHVD